MIMTKLSQIISSGKRIWKKESCGKDSGKMKVVINRASKLHDKLLNICAAQYNKLSEQSKKSVSV